MANETLKEAPVLNRKLRGQDHRLLWWMLAVQERDASGAGTGLVANGWRERAKRELDLPSSQISRSQKRLMDAGVLVPKLWQREVRIAPDAFNLD